MSDTQAPIGIYALLKPVVIAHPNLFVPKAFGKKGKEEGTPKYSANVVFPADSEDLKTLKELAGKVAKAKWPGRSFKDKEDPSKNILFPFTNGTVLADKRKAESGKDDGEYQRGMIVVAARSKYEPRLSIFEKGKVTEFASVEEAKPHASKWFYFGVQGLVKINLVAYKGVGRNPDGVTAYLDAFMSIGTGKKLTSGGGSAAEAFKGYVGQTTGEDVLAGDQTIEDTVEDVVE